MKTNCPECDGEIKVYDDAISGEIVTCPDCGMDFEVILEENGSVILREAEVEGEDWGE